MCSRPLSTFPSNDPVFKDSRFPRTRWFQSFWDSYNTPILVRQLTANCLCGHHVLWIVAWHWNDKRWITARGRPRCRWCRYGMRMREILAPGGSIGWELEVCQIVAAKKKKSSGKKIWIDLSDFFPKCKHLLTYTWELQGRIYVERSMAAK